MKISLVCHFNRLRFLCLAGVLVFLMTNCTGEAVPAGKPIPTSPPLPPTNAPQTPSTPSGEDAIKTPSAPIALTPEPEIGPAQTLQPAVEKGVLAYHAQSGDTIEAIAKRFGVEVAEITSPEVIPTHAFLNPDQSLNIPDKLDESTLSLNQKFLPDSEVIFSETAAGFDVSAFLQPSGGYLSGYSQLLGDGWYRGDDIVNRISLNESINPRLLLALLEFQGHWISREPMTQEEANYPFGYVDYDRSELFNQMSWAAEQLSTGYYGWRTGKITELIFPDGGHLRLAPDLNAGSVSLMFFFSKLYNYPDWYRRLYAQDNFLTLYAGLFGDYWGRAEALGPLIPGGLKQPDLIFPMSFSNPWNFTGGPHAAWGDEGALAAVDFAPSGIDGCSQSADWVISASAGKVAREWNGLVVVDLDMDGDEHTGWDLIYQHVAKVIIEENSNLGRVEVGSLVKPGDFIGYPSCAGGISSGTHVHFARRYNGEWMLANGAVPMVLSGWTVQAGDAVYQGKMVKDGQMITSNQFGMAESLIIH